MNTLSSILSFLGSVLGANPNTLTTTNKTIVGAINELKSSIPTNTRRIKFVTVDSNTLTIEGEETGAFFKSYFLDQPISGKKWTPYLVGYNLKATGSRYSRVFLYGGSLVKTQTTPLWDVYELGCSGRNTSSSNATGLVVTFRLLLMTSES